MNDPVKIKPEIIKDIDSHLVDSNKSFKLSLGDFSLVRYALEKYPYNDQKLILHIINNLKSISPEPLSSEELQLILKSIYYQTIIKNELKIKERFTYIFNIVAFEYLPAKYDIQQLDYLEKFYILKSVKNPSVIISDEFECEYDSENESLIISSDEVKASGMFHANEDYLEDFVNGPYSKKILLTKIGLDKFIFPFSIESIEVDKNLRNQNIGTKAIKTLETIACQMGADVVVLNASPIGTHEKEELLNGVINFYKTLGYKLIRKSDENAEMFKKLENK